MTIREQVGAMEADVVTAPLLARMSHGRKRQLARIAIASAAAMRDKRQRVERMPAIGIRWARYQRWRCRRGLSLGAYAYAGFAGVAGDVSAEQRRSLDDSALWRA